MSNTRARAQDFKIRDAASYDAVVDAFDAYTDRFSPPLAARVVALARLAPSDHVLDVGAGTGIVALEAVRQLGQQGSVLGIDLSERMINAAAAKAAKAAVSDRATFRQMDAEALTLEDQSFDVVISLFALLHFPDPATALREMCRVLRLGGRLVVAVGSRPPLLSASGLVHRFSYLPKMIAEWRGRRLVAPRFLDALVRQRFPEHGEPEQAPLADAGLNRTARVADLITSVGFTNVATHWEGHEAIIDDPAEFWEIQRTFSSVARKRLTGRPRNQVDAVREEFLARCRVVQARGGTLVYPFAAFFVVAERPAG